MGQVQRLAESVDVPLEAYLDATTTEDESVTGVLREETDSAIRLLQVGGTLAEVPLAAALEIRASNLSLMPEGLESGLTRDGLADLIAYLESLR